MPDVLTTTVTATKSAEEIDKTIGLVAKVIGKLKAQPDIAALKLDQALDEVAKTLHVVDGAAASYLSLGIDEGALEKNSALLLHIESGQLAVEVRNSLGHCHRIWHIYETSLNKWFSKVLSRDESNSMHKVFLRLGDADGDLFADLAQIADMLKDEATAVLDLVVKGHKEAAREKVLASFAAFRPLRKSIASTMQKLYTLKNDFADMAQVT